MEQKLIKKDNLENEHGAIIVEATISLSVFMFAMFMLLFLIQIAYAQSKMSVALDCAAKEMAEYTHVYFITGMNESLSGTGGKSSEMFNEVAKFLQEVAVDTQPLSSELSQFVDNTGKALSGDSITDFAKSGTGQLLAQQMMKKNLISETGAGADDFFRRYNISALDLSDSKILEQGGNEIFLRARYDIKVIKLLNLDYTFHMSTWAYTTAWSGQ